jgi:anti-anti-sigma regulatory factor
VTSRWTPPPPRASTPPGVTLLVHETDAHHRAGGRPELRNPSRAVLQALRLTGMADLFDVVTD